MGHMLKNVRIVRLTGERSGLKASSYIVGRAVDMQGFEGALFLIVGTTNTGGTTVYGIIQGASATGGTFRKIAGTSSTGPWTTGNNDRKIMAIDVYKPLSTHRQLRPVLVGSCTGEISGMFAIQYGLRKPGSSDVWKSSTRAGSSRWQSSKLGSQVLAVSATATTKTTG